MKKLVYILAFSICFGCLTEEKGGNLPSIAIPEELLGIWQAEQLLPDNQLIQWSEFTFTTSEDNSGRFEYTRSALIDGINLTLIAGLKGDFTVIDNDIVLYLSQVCIHKGPGDLELTTIDSSTSDWDSITPTLILKYKITDNCLIITSDENGDGLISDHEISSFINVSDNLIYSCS